MSSETPKIGDRVRIATDAHFFCPRGREGVVVLCSCGLSHGDTLSVAVYGSKSRSVYSFRADELEVIS